MSASERKFAAVEAERDELVQKVRELRQLLKQQMLTGEELEFSAIVNSDGTPLVDLRWDRLAAQVSTDDARALALDLLRVSEWADVDATAFLAIREAFDEKAAAGIMAILRRGRGGDDHASGRVKSGSA